MAITQKGIYYPDDYTAVADVPEDMKKQAESVDTALANIEDTIEQDIQTQIDNINEEQTTQDNEITALQTENTRLKATLPTTTGSGENITLSKTAELEFIQPPSPRGNSEQVQYSGKNLLPVEENLTFTRVKTLNVNLPAGTYHVTFSNITRSTDEGNTVIRFNANGKAEYLANTAKDFTVNLTTTETTIYIYARNDYSGSAGITATINQLMISTAGGDYEPYVGGTASPNPSYPQAITNVTGDVEVVVQNKNLFDGEMELGIINGTTGANISNSSYIRSKNYIPVEELTSYKFSTDSASITTILIYEYKEDYSYNLTSNKNLSLTGYLTTNEGTKYIRFRPYNETTDTSIKVQIEKGTTATPYTPHKEQTYTFPLGTQRMYLGDYLADDGIHHVKKQVVWNGTESWLLNQEKTNSILFSLSISDMVNIGNVMGLDIKSNYFTPGNAYALDKELIEQISRSLYINIDKSRLNNADLVGFKTWLSTHNVIVEYELAEEEIIPYTTEQQQAYDEIKQALSYEEQTNISGSSDESNPLLNVEAYQSTKLVLASLN